MALTREDLHAIKILLEEKLDPIDKRLGAIEERLGTVDGKLEVIEERLGTVDEKLEVIEERLTTAEAGLEAVQRDLEVTKQKITKLELMLENETNRNIQLLAENHIELINKLNQAIKVADKNLCLEVQVSDLRMKAERLLERVERLESEPA